MGEWSRWNGYWSVVVTEWYQCGSRKGSDRLVGMIDKDDRVILRAVSTGE